MFTTRSCGYCKQARAFFRDKQIDYCEYDVTGRSSNDEYFYALGGQGVPLILVKEQPMYGYNEAALSRLLEESGIL